ncbi:D-glucuronyl C5-epimerase family protein [Thermus albus]|uniref:D-glucuronyl C5-epimerase family protein n=1 Tax=Thermus albus TaxID=2908146 RepID=UPI001FA98ED6|nr:D-glucuronyl C5-epimerase family protein [Thermus albus]
MFLGKSYWHVPQGLGKEFAPGKLSGYFNDLTAKTQWRGPVDERGLPLNEVGGKRLYFATTLFQKALGHWDLWLASNERNETHRSAFLRIAQWALKTQDEHGGWPLWPLLGLHYVSRYSAMTQGQGISVLVRAYRTTGDVSYLDAARRALAPMRVPLDRGGTCRIVPEGCVLEETPSDEYRAILNGWVFALFGLYDYLLVEDVDDVRSMLEETLSALVAYLPKYNAGYWSYYDLSGHLASPFYHQLHIAQLQALALAFPIYVGVFRTIEERFQWQLRHPVCKIRAVATKAVQKLRNPPEVVLK